MCLAIPAQVVACNLVDQTATVNLGGVVKEISLMLVDHVSVGDFVLVHVGFALHKISPLEAKKTLALFAQANVLEPLQGPPPGLVQ